MGKEVIIVAMSDSHGNHRDVHVPECDILIHAGDISNFNKSEHYDDFFPWFSSQPAKHKILIGGNHDDILDSQAKWVFLSRFPDIIYLDGDMVELGGLRIWGSPIQPRPFKMAFCREREERSLVWKRLPSDIDIVVSHCPPFGFLDKNVEGNSVGCDVLRDAIALKRPKLSLFGHIHEAYGITSNGETVFANCSVVNRTRRVVNQPWVFKMVDGRIEVRA
jgi:Icc-related predicted phosphoesterase